MTCKYDDFWRRKIRAHFARLDTDSDGVLTVADLENMSSGYSVELNEEKGQRMRVVLFEYWDVILSDLAKTQPITADVYNEALIKFGQERLLDYVNPIELLWMDLMDPTGSGFIDADGFAVWFKVIGVDEDHSALALDAFTSMELSPDAKMTREEYIEAVREFFIGANQQSP